MSETDFDFEDVELPQSKNSIEDIATLVNMMVAKEAEIEAMNNALAELTNEYKRIAEEVVPNAMDSAGISEFKLTDGRKLKVEDYLKASISEERKPAAYEWLKEHNHEDLIKPKVEFVFDKGEVELAQTVLQDILDIHGLSGKFSESIHNSTLVAFCKEQLAQGVELDEKLFGIYKGRVAKFKKR